MSQVEAVISGTLKPDGTLELDEKPKLPPGRVTVRLREGAGRFARPLGAEFFRTMESIWAGQKARGHIPRPLGEVEAARRELQNEVEDEIGAAIKLQDECRQRRERTNSEMPRP